MKTFKDAYTAGELAAALGVTDRAVQMRARREGWQARRRPGRGGGNEWLVVSMPEGTALAVRMAEERTAVAAAATSPSTLPGAPAPLDPKRRQ
jgi:putative transposase